MSWDVFVQDFPDVGTLEEMPDDFEPKTIGKRQDVINKIKEVVPFADFSDPSWGIRREGCRDRGSGRLPCGAFMIFMRRSKCRYWEWVG